MYSAYVTFKRPSDCAAAISLCHHTALLGHVLKATYGTTKYCAFYTRGVPCTMVKCSYLHEAAKPEDVVGKEELAAMERYREHEKPTPFPLQLTVAEAVAAAKSLRALQPMEEEAQEGKPSAVASVPGAHTTPPASVWGTRSAQPVAALFPASSAASASTAASTASAATASASSSSSSSLRPYVSILAQSQTATQPAPSTSTQAPSQPSAASLPASNEIIRIIPAFLKDKFAVSSPSSSASSASRKRGGSGNVASVPPALSPSSSATSMTASPSMSRSTSKASSSSTSSRTSSPHNSPLLQPVDPSTPSAPSPLPPQSPQPPLLEPTPLSPSSLASAPVASTNPAATTVDPAASLSPASAFPVSPLPLTAGPHPPPEEDFDFLLYSLSDFTPFFRTYAADDPHFSWLLTLPQARHYPLRPRRVEQPSGEVRASSIEALEVVEAQAKEGGSVGGVDVAGAESGGVKERGMEWDEQKQAMRAASPAATIAPRNGHTRAR